MTLTVTGPLDPAGQLKVTLEKKYAFWKEKEKPENKKIKREDPGSTTGPPRDPPTPVFTMTRCCPRSSVSQKTQPGVPILSDKELLVQLFWHFGRLPDRESA